MVKQARLVFFSLGWLEAFCRDLNRVRKKDGSLEWAKGMDGAQM